MDSITDRQTTLWCQRPIVYYVHYNWLKSGLWNSTGAVVAVAPSWLYLLTSMILCRMEQVSTMWHMQGFVGKSARCQVKMSRLFQVALYRMRSAASPDSGIVSLSLLFKIFTYIWQSKQYETQRSSRTARLQKTNINSCPLKRNKKVTIKHRLWTKPILLKLIVLLKPNMNVTTKIDFN